MPSGDDRAAVQEAIRGAILRGDYAPRQRLIEAELCERFGSSRFEIRNALQELASHGLVEFQPNRGARVREITFAEVIEITEVRRMLEGFEAARAAERVTKAEAAALKQITRDMRAAVGRSELLRYSDLNKQLHGAIRDIAAHETSARLLRRLRDQTVRHQFSLSLVPGRPSVSLPQHEAIVEAVIAKDPSAAEAAMHAHLQSVIEAFRALSAAVAQP
ncbi:GntR family transcriptional regulator [Streptosporangium subroseum]|uniref:GntR family transcriptional regulator n=1 Tax=Streptosporangium subroseum TaxID=106412 RepID=UPI0030855A3A|nr:GntR family transcriptional regulator [Streptosporangium subroseum]